MRNFVESGYPQGTRRTFPQSPDNRGPSHRPPDRPAPRTYQLPESATFLPVNGHGIPPSQRHVAINEAYIKEGQYGESVRGFTATPITQEPLTPPFYTSAGGGRVGGGGTSRKTVRTARRKAKNPR